MNKKEKGFIKQTNKRTIVTKEEMLRMIENVYKDDKDKRIEKELKLLAKR